MPGLRQPINLIGGDVPTPGDPLMEPDDSQPYGPARWVLPTAVLALLIWPLSLAWVPTSGHGPDWVSTLVSVAEIGAVLLAMVAYGLGLRAHRMEGSTKSSDLGMRLASLVVLLAIGGKLLSQALVE